MTTSEQIGDRVREARLDRKLGVKNAAEQSGLARDTWYRIEAGKPVQDAKRHAALRFLGLDSDGLQGQALDELPVTFDNLDPRLNNIERQIDALWQRLDELVDGADEPQPASKDDYAKAARPPDPRGSRGRQHRRDQDDDATGSQDPGGLGDDA